MGDVAGHGLQAQGVDLQHARQIDARGSGSVKLACGVHIAQSHRAIGQEADVAPRTVVCTGEAGHAAPLVGTRQSGVLIGRRVGQPLEIAVHLQLATGLGHPRTGAHTQSTGHVERPARLLETIEHAIATQAQRTCGHLQRAATADGRDVHRQHLCRPGGCGRVELDRAARRNHDRRHVGHVRHRTGAAEVVGRRPVDGVEPFARGAAHPSGRRQLGHVGRGAAVVAVDHVVAGRNARHGRRGADRHLTRRAHVLAGQHRVHLELRPVVDGVGISHRDRSRGGAVVGLAGTGDDQIDIARSDGQGAVGTRERVFGRSQTSQVVTDRVAAHIGQQSCGGAPQTQRSGHRIGKVVARQEASDFLSEDRVRRAIGAGAADRCHHQHRLRHRQLAIGVADVVVAQTGACGSRGCNGVAARRLRGGNSGVASDLQGHTRHRIRAFQARHTEFLRTQGQTGTKICALVTGGDGERRRIDTAIAAAHTGGTTADDVVVCLSARKAQVAERIANVGKDIATAIAADIGRVERTHPRDRQLGAVDLVGRSQVGGNHAGVRRRAATSDRQAQGHVVHGGGAVVRLANAACSRHRHRTACDAGGGGRLVRDAVVADVCPGERRGDIDRLARASIGIGERRARAGVAHRIAIDQAHGRANGRCCQGGAICAVVHLVRDREARDAQRRFRDICGRRVGRYHVVVARICAAQGGSDRNGFPGADIPAGPQHASDIGKAGRIAQGQHIPPHAVVGGGYAGICIAVVDLGDTGIGDVQVTFADRRVTTRQAGIAEVVVGSIRTAERQTSHLVRLGRRSGRILIESVGRAVVRTGNRIAAQRTVDGQLSRAGHAPNLYIFTTHNQPIARIDCGPETSVHTCDSCPGAGQGSQPCNRSTEVVGRSLDEHGIIAESLWSIKHQLITQGHFGRRSCTGTR